MCEQRGCKVAKHQIFPWILLHLVTFGQFQKTWACYRAMMCGQEGPPQCQANMFCQIALKSLSFCQCQGVSLTCYRATMGGQGGCHNAKQTCFSDLAEIVKFLAVSEGFANLLQSHDGWTRSLPQCQANMFCQILAEVLKFLAVSEVFADLLQSHGGWKGRLPRWHQWRPQPSPHLLLTRHSGR